jgi:hypothetical protein
MFDDYIDLIVNGATNRTRFTESRSTGGGV